MNLSLLLASTRRESRGARTRLFFFTACLAVGVAAVVGVAGLTDAIEDGMAGQSRELLAADLRVSSSFELPVELEHFFENTPGAVRADLRELVSMVSLPGPEPERLERRSSHLAEIKAVQSGYPFYGTLETRPPDYRRRLDASNALVAPELLSALEIQIGDQISIGNALFEVLGEVVDEPDRVNFSMTLGPRVFLTDEGLERTSLVQFGSRIRRRALFAFSEHSSEEIGAFARRLEEELPDPQNLRVETRESTQGQIRSGLARVEHFLGLVALLSLVLGAIGVAQIARAWIAERTADIAVRRALGFRPREILILYLTQVALLAVIGSVLGAAAGASLPYLAPHLAPEFLSADLIDPWQPGAILTGISLGLLIALVFALPPLTAVWSVSPARVLRAEAQPLSAPRAVLISSRFVIVAGIFCCALVQTRDLVFAGVFTGGLLVIAALLGLAARAVTALAARLPHRGLSPYWVHGLAALGRPGQGTSGAVVSLGLGVLVVTTLILVERRLETELGSILPERAPTSFMVDIQPAQWEGVRQLLVAENASRIDSVPVVTGRLMAIDGFSVRDLERSKSEDGDAGPSRWALGREQRLTWLDELPEDNQLVEGELWNDPATLELSVEQEFAKNLNIELGSELLFDLQGIPFLLTVTSLRTVSWKSFAINFFLIAEPGIFENAPHYRIAAARMETEDEDRLQDRLAANFANVTLLRIRAIIEKLAEVMQKLALGVRILAAFTILVGMAVLAGAVSSNGLRRTREAALLKTLGLTRRQVLFFFAVEYALVGLVAGTVGAIGALASAFLFVEHALELPFGLSVWVPLAAIAASTLAATLCGLAASTRAILARPMRTLHGMSGVGGG